jgi:hypothetical protein
VGHNLFFYFGKNLKINNFIVSASVSLLILLSPSVSEVQQDASFADGTYGTEVEEQYY